MKSVVPTLILVTLSAAACNNGSSTPTGTIAAPAQSVTFSGSYAPLANSTAYNFTVPQAGEVDIDVTALGPPATISQNLYLGVTTGTTNACSVGSVGSQAITASNVSQISVDLNPGTYCIVLGDPGNAATTVSFSMTVAYP